jgi:glycosyltransferase involved in cell wall biosynthesis
MPMVSVVVPNYNHAKYLRQRLESVLTQTYQDFELILLDDCSTDESRDVLRSFAGSARVRTEFNTENSGTPFKQWNKGVRQARGKYVWIAESDDYADPTFLERLTDVLESDETIPLAYCQSWSVDEGGATDGLAGLHLNALDWNRWKQSFVRNGLEECRDFFVLANPVPNASAVVFRKDAYEEAGGADERLRLCGDYKVWAAIACQGKIAFVADPLNYYRSHSGNVRTQMRRDPLGLAEFFYVAQWIAAYISQLIAPGDELVREMEGDALLQRVPGELNARERIETCLRSLTYLKAWSLRHNRQFPPETIERYFGQWEFAIEEKQFEVSPPRRWPYFLQKCRFYRYYYPTMTWGQRVEGLLRAIGSGVVGYKNRNWTRSAYERLAAVWNADLRKQEPHGAESRRP